MKPLIAQLWISCIVLEWSMLLCLRIRTQCIGMFDLCMLGLILLSYVVLAGLLFYNALNPVL